ncbi:hypothetical protein GOBAR_AA33974 [Gossypium barbadense]|uniref:Uncharacterized protein n=1 Tax=Gossypium barbadense TaxID=3634 RepID=A0A2P5W6M9_GOSBA|nr:hypothetical protein GOBAR_AA33974 [Gossypium barbadense]
MVSEGKNEVGPNKQKSEISSKDTHQLCSIHNKESTHEERRLRIEELDEWLTFKPRKHDKPKLRQNKLNASPNQLQLGDKVLLDATDPLITTSELNEETLLTVTSIFPYGTVQTTLEQVQLADDVRALLTTDPWDLFFVIIKLTYLELTLELCSTFHVQDVMTNFDDPGIVQFRLDSLVYQLSVPKFGIALGLYTEEFMDENDLTLSVATSTTLPQSVGTFWSPVQPPTT